jgi:hypothetical protein
MKAKKIMFLLLASLVWGACTSDDENAGEGNGNGNDNGNGNGQKLTYVTTPQEEPPVWQMDWSYNQEKPRWTKPDESLYETSTPLTVTIEEALQPYVSKDDMMAVFINGELRGLATQPAVIVGDEQATSHLFVMRAYGNETGTVKISLSYYCKKLNHIFTLSQDLNLNSDESLGTDEDFIPPFTLGSAKYPVTKTVVAEQYLMLADITPIEGNLLGAFVGDECRGKVALSASGNTPLVIYGRNPGETVTLKYYDAIGGLLFTIPDAVKL